MIKNQIDRRHFLGISGIFTAFSTLTGRAEENDDTPDLDWRESAMRNLHRPRLSLSAGKGTVMIEWTRGEECDSSSTFRWIISKTGTVLRHHEMGWHEC